MENPTKMPTKRLPNAYQIPKIEKTRKNNNQSMEEGLNLTSTFKASNDVVLTMQYLILNA